MAGQWVIEDGPQWVIEDDAPEEKGGFLQGVVNLGAGALRGAGSIGATLLAPKDIVSDALAGRGLSLQSNRERRAAMDAGLQTMGAQPDSWMYKGGKLGGEIAGTAGAGGVLGNVAARLGASAPVVSALTSSGFNVAGKTGAAAHALRAAGGAATGAASAGLVNPEEAGTGALIGGVLPGAAKVAGMAGRGVRNTITGGGASPEVVALAKRAKDLGINIPADRLVNSRPLNAVSGGLNYIPLSGRAATEEAMNTQLNQALSKTFGQNSSNVSQALRKAETVLGGQFDDFLKNNTVKVDDLFIDDLTDAVTRASKELGSDGASIIGKQVDEIIGKTANGQIDGQAAYNIKKTLDRIGKRNSPEAYYALDLKRKLMDALNRSVSPDDAAKFATTRQQYGSMLDLQKLATNGVDGEISVARLANMKNIKNPQMQELADIAAQFVKPREGAHGSAQRALVGMGAGAVGGIPGLVGGMALGRSANMLLNSNAAKNLVLQQPGLLGEPAALGLLSQGLIKAAPVLGSQFNQ